MFPGDDLTESLFLELKSGARALLDRDGLELPLRDATETLPIEEDENLGVENAEHVST